MSTRIYYLNLVFEILFVLGIFLFYSDDTYISMWGTIIVYVSFGIWVMHRIINNKYSQIELIALFIASMAFDDNIIITVGLLIETIYMVSHVKKIKGLVPNKEAIFFFCLVVVGYIASELNAINKTTAMYNCIVYGILGIYVYISSKNTRLKNNDTEEFSRLFSELSAILGIVFYFRNPMNQIWRSNRIYIFYNGDSGVVSNTLAGLVAPFLVGCIIIFFMSKEFMSKISTSLRSL